MLIHKHKSHSKTNPKKQKRHRIVNLSRPKVPSQMSKTIVEHEKLSDWANAS